MTDTDSGHITAWAAPTTWRTRLTHRWNTTRAAIRDWAARTEATALDHPGADDTWSPLAEYDTDLPDTGRHHRHTVKPADPGHGLSPAARQEIDPTYWADRYLQAGPDERTGLINPRTVAAVLAQAKARTHHTERDFDAYIKSLTSRKEAKP